MSRELDDQLVIVLLVLAVAIALLGMRQPAVLVVGVALGGSGVALGMRGKRLLPSRTRRWLLGLMGAAVVGVLAIGALGFYESWETGQLLAIEASMPRIEAQLGKFAVWRRALEIGSVVTAVALLAASVVAYLRPGAPPDPGSK